MPNFERVIADYLRRDAEARAKGLRGHLIAGGAPDDDPPPEEDDPPPEGESDLGDAGKAALKALRDERNTARREAREAQAKLKELEDRDLSESQKAQKRAEEAEARATAAEVQIRQRDAMDAVADEARSQKAIRPEVLARRAVADIEFDDAGKPTNVKAVVADLKKDFPELFNPAANSADGGAGRGDSGTSTDMSANIRRMAGRRSA